MANGSPINILEDKAIDPITLSIGIAMAVGAVTKAAHEKSVARQQYYAQRLNEEAQAIAAAETELAEKRKKTLQLFAVQAALNVRKQREAEAAKQVAKEKQAQTIIIATLGVGAIGLITYSIVKK
jgi:molecular chaperone GrpE (heat shock protein)